MGALFSDFVVQHAASFFPLNSCSQEVFVFPQFDCVTRGCTTLLPHFVIQHAASFFYSRSAHFSPIFLRISWVHYSTSNFVVLTWLFIFFPPIFQQQKNLLLLFVSLHFFFLSGTNAELEPRAETRACQLAASGGVAAPPHLR